MITKRGQRVDCDFAVVGVGVEPVVDVVADSGVETSNGILVDEYCRTNVQDIYAAGDVANHYHPVFQKRMRVERGLAMNALAAVLPNLVGGSADLDPSTRTVLRGCGDFENPRARSADGPATQGIAGGVWGYAGRNIP